MHELLIEDLEGGGCDDVEQQPNIAERMLRGHGGALRARQVLEAQQELEVFQLL